MSVKIRVNLESCIQKIDLAAKKVGRPIAQKKAENLFYRAKRLMLRDFDQHVVTNELKTEGGTDNISLTTEGYGNLFAFFGFPQGEDPTSELRELLAAGTTLRFTSFTHGAWHFRVNLPSETAIDESTQFGGGSWVDKVENGLNNLDRFLYVKGYGRSNQGFQAPFEINEDFSFQPKPYLSEIFETFRNRINKSSINDA